MGPKLLEISNFSLTSGNLKGWSGNHKQVVTTKAGYQKTSGNHKQVVTTKAEPSHQKQVVTTKAEVVQKRWLSKNKW